MKTWEALHVSRIAMELAADYLMRLISTLDDVNTPESAKAHQRLKDAIKIAKEHGPTGEAEAERLAQLETMLARLCLYDENEIDAAEKAPDGDDYNELWDIFHPARTPEQMQFLPPVERPAPAQTARFYVVSGLSGRTDGTVAAGPFLDYDTAETVAGRYREPGKTWAFVDERVEREEAAPC